MKKNYKKLYTKEITSKAATTEFLSKIPNRKKISNGQFNLCETKISLDKVIKPINSQKNKSPCLTAEFFKHFSNELAPVILDVYDPWGKLGTMPVTSRTGIISVIYKKSDKKYIANYRLILLLNLDYKTYATILKNRMEKMLDTIIGENQSPAIKNRTILHTLSTIRDITDLCVK